MKSIKLIGGKMKKMESKMEVDQLRARYSELIMEAKWRQNYIRESVLYLKTLSRMGGLIDLKPKWHLTKKGIDLNRQRYTSLPNEYLDDMRWGYTILKEVNCKQILKSISTGDAKIFRKKKVFNLWYNDSYVSEILFYWLNGQKMIPPTIMHNGVENFLVDGKHRFNVAYSLGAQTMPLLVANKHLEGVNACLKEVI